MVFQSASHRTAQPAKSANSGARNGKPTALSAVYELVADDFNAVNSLIPQQLSSDVELVEQIGHYIIESGGKRLRPLMVLLSSRGLGYAGDAHIGLAAIIEFLHTATLLHDDVVDHSGLRRGKLTANERWGNAPSVLVGDFLYSRAFQLMVELGSMEVMGVLSSATNTIAQGEVMQLANVGNHTLSEDQYREVIRCKTALLFEAATHTGAILAHQADTDITQDQVTSMRKFGMHFGIAYQLIDDWLDYVGDAETMGKNVGDDLAEGKPTLPLIYALRHAAQSEQTLIQDALTHKSTKDLPDILCIVKECGALNYTHEAAITESRIAEKCLAQIPAGPFKQALVSVTEFSLSRLF